MRGETSAVAPHLIMSRGDADRLSDLALRTSISETTLSDFLLAEIARAEIRAECEVPETVVRMNSCVQFRDEKRSRSYTLQIVYPVEADISQNKISILTPIGVALLGLSAGQSITWLDDGGQERTLRVLHVT